MLLSKCSIYIQNALQIAQDSQENFMYIQEISENF